MATSKPKRPKLTVEQALRNLLRLTQDYVSAAAAHCEADCYGAQERVDAANRKAETAYSALVLCMGDAEKALEVLNGRK